jgi:AcrR family transcriptional regulator
LAAIKGDSKSNLLDAAEALFAEKGFDATTTREIAARSGDTLGTLSYHFGSKQRLLEEIFRRRFAIVSDLRGRYFEEARAEGQGGRPSLEGVVRSIVLPYMDLLFSGDPGCHNYINLLGRMRESGNDEQQSFFMGFAESNMRLCIGWLAEVAPGVGHLDLVYAYELASMLAISSCSDIARRRVAILADGMLIPPEVFRRHILTFILNGVRASLRLS